jgi:EAL domain-containing protein (putative c-di-GMP-specific phosphodiesterase class I)/GGDEF domain-containing protein
LDVSGGRDEIETAGKVRTMVTLGSAVDPSEARHALLQDMRAHIEYAFQPIVNVHTGMPFGFEALLRGYERLGFPTVEALLDQVFQGELASAAEQILRDKAISRFMAAAIPGHTRLFYNLDDRVLRLPGCRPEEILASLQQHGLPAMRFCIELSEAHAIADPSVVQGLARSQGGAFPIAIDDFGTGYSGLRLLCESHPDLVKVDHFFTSRIDSDQKKKVFLSAIVNLAHVLGISVVAEGVETEAEFRVCREIGCDYVQGFFVAHPSTTLEHLLPRYEIVTETNRSDRRDRGDSSQLVRSELETLSALSITAPMREVLETFRHSHNRPFLPVVDSQDQPVGIVLEADLKEFVYSPFGKDVLSNRGTPYRLQQFLKPCLVCEVNTPTDQILGAFALRDDDPAILIAEGGRYLGVLRAAAIVRILNERTLYLARNENPLTRLPGNASIADYLAQAFEETDSAWTFAYFDLDHFKPFNDRFGFRQGDRAILMFATLLRSHLDGADVFLGHIGGDDFFAGFRNPSLPAVRQDVATLLGKFAADAASFYDEDARRAGAMPGSDREGRPTLVPLLTASCALLDLAAGTRPASLDEMSTSLAMLKKQAKRSAAKIAIGTVG